MIGTTPSNTLILIEAIASPNGNSKTSSEVPKALLQKRSTNRLSLSDGTSEAMHEHASNKRMAKLRDAVAEVDGLNNK